MCGWTERPLRSESRVARPGELKEFLLAHKSWSQVSARHWRVPARLNSSVSACWSVSHAAPEIPTRLWPVTYDSFRLGVSVVCSVAINVPSQTQFPCAG